MSANIRHSSETNEHYTPTPIVLAARRVLERIDLDPASCDFANKFVQAPRIFTAEDDGFTRPWWGRVLLNPPGGRSDDQQRPVKPKCRETGACGLPPGHTHAGVESSQKKWWFKLAEEFLSGRVEAAIFVAFSLELLQTTQSGFFESPRPWPLHFDACFPRTRVAYDREVDGVRKSGTSPPHASFLVLLSRDEQMRTTFAREFGMFGAIVRSWISVGEP